jgi:hypothetical protein
MRHLPGIVRAAAGSMELPFMRGGAGIATPGRRHRLRAGWQKGCVRLKRQLTIDRAMR